MSTKNNFIKYATLTAATLLMWSCSDYLEERSQDTYYVTSYKDLDELLIGDCYAPVNAATSLAYTEDLGFFINYLADEIDEQHGEIYSYDEGNRERIFGYYTWQQRTGETYNKKGYYSEDGTWNETYRLINVANNILESADKVPQNTDDEKEGVIRVKGEAHFLRAAYYFWLANLYGKPYTAATAATDLAVPIKTIAKVNDVMYKRNTVQEVYNQVIDDLDKAETLLAQTGNTKSVYRADVNAVHFLKSRVYLYMQNWSMASKYADEVIKAKPGLVDFNTLTGAPLTKGSVETIFSMGGAELPCSICNYYQSLSVSKDLYNAYSDDDLRKTKYWWKCPDYDFYGYTKIPVPSTQTTTPDDENYYQDMYYHAMSGQKAEVSDKFLYRTSEAYLIKAEAEAYLGNDTEARNLLNKLRQKRYKTGTNYEVNASGKELVEAIREERRLELALEGTRWFDLRRYSVCEKYPESKPITHYFSVYKTWRKIQERRKFVLNANDPAYTLPIPNEVTTFHTGMPNNERPERNYTVD